MVRCGFSPKEAEAPESPRPYHPHITLARFHGSLRLSQIQRALPSSLQRTFTADAVNLYRSHVTPTGANYQILAQKKSTIRDPIPKTGKPKK
jgi:2'-5' RNA ligase